MVFVFLLPLGFDNMYLSALLMNRDNQLVSIYPIYVYYNILLSLFLW
jgi:hypothetical protein